MKLNINLDIYLELEKISNGSFYPLKGFMEEKDFYSVLKENGDRWETRSLRAYVDFKPLVFVQLTRKRDYQGADISL